MIVNLKLNQVKELRKVYCLSQSQLAMLSGLGEATISDIENGKQIPSQITMLKISKAFGLPVTQVFLLDYRNLKL